MLLSDRFPQASLEKMHENLRSMGEQYGINFNPSEKLPNSHKLLEAGEYAKEKGKFHVFHEEAFRAYFTQGRDIGSMEVILSSAETSGLDGTELQERINAGTYGKVLEEVQRTAHQYGINSTPTFIIDSKYAIVGAQPLEAFRQALTNIEKEKE